MTGARGQGEREASAEAYLSTPHKRGTERRRDRVSVTCPRPQNSGTKKAVAPEGTTALNVVSITPKQARDVHRSKLHAHHPKLCGEPLCPVQRPRRTGDSRPTSQRTGEPRPTLQDARSTWTASNLPNPTRTEALAWQPARQRRRIRPKSSHTVAASRPDHHRPKTVLVPPLRGVTAPSQPRSTEPRRPPQHVRPESVDRGDRRRAPRGRHVVRASGLRHSHRRGA